MSKTTVTTVADKIKEEREKAGWTQTELAKRAGITPSALSQIESGERYPSTLVLSKLARALSVSMDYLVGEKQEDELHSMLHNENVKALFNGFKELSANDKDTILKQVEWLRSRKKSK
jgi:transcriptional regulator with XRE-family HTH domain